MTLQKQMKDKLESLGLPYKKIKVYGTQITVECISLDSIEKWRAILAKFCKIRGIVEDTVENQVNKNTVLLPTRHKVHRLYAQINIV